MQPWIRRPPGQPDQRWHLEALLPSPKSLLFSACGLRWTESDVYTLERVEDASRIPDDLRCEACRTIYRLSRGGASLG